MQRRFEGADNPLLAVVNIVRLGVVRSKRRTEDNLAEWIYRMGAEASILMGPQGKAIFAEFTIAVATGGDPFFRGGE